MSEEATTSPKVVPAGGAWNSGGIALMVPAILPAVYDQDEAGQQRLIMAAEPCPELLTEAEAIRYLRLDTIGGTKNPAETLERYRAMGRLRGTQVGRKVFFRRVELDRFLELQTDSNPR